MVVKDKLVFRDEEDNKIYVTKEGHWYGINRKKQQLDLNNMILLLESVGFNIARLTKDNGNVMLEINEEKIEEEDLT